MKVLRLAILALSTTVVSCTSLPPPQRVSSSDVTHSYVLAGHGPRTVVMEAGLGDGKETWAPIFGKVSQFAKVFAYDRAGYGSSRSRNQSRDGTMIVNELRATLKALKLEPPFVLVGHSIGGTYMELYARSHPDDVAGVVLVDSRHADFTRKCKAAAATGCEPPSAIMLLMPPAVKREFSGAAETEIAIKHSGPFPGVPLAVLTSGKAPPLTGGRFREVWLETQDALAQMSRLSSREICARCGHYVHKDNPMLVVASIQRVIAQGRASQRK